MTFKFMINDSIYNEIDVVEYPDNYEQLTNVGISWDELDNIRNEMARIELENNSESYGVDDIESFDGDQIDDIVRDIAGDYISVKRFYRDSLLAYGLAAWYGSFEKMENSIRGLVEYEDYYYYNTGVGYDTISSDLLGREANGVAKQEFIDFLNQSVVDNWQK